MARPDDPAAHDGHGDRNDRGGRGGDGGHEPYPFRDPDLDDTADPHDTPRPGDPRLDTAAADEPRGSDDGDEEGRHWEDDGEAATRRLRVRAGERAARRGDVYQRRRRTAALAGVAVLAAVGWQLAGVGDTADLAGLLGDDGPAADAAPADDPAGGGDTVAAHTAVADAVVDDAAAALGASGQLDDYHPDAAVTGDAAVHTAGHQATVLVAVGGETDCVAAALVDGQPMRSAHDPTGQACQPGAVADALADRAGLVASHGDADPTPDRADDNADAVAYVADAAAAYATYAWRDAAATFEGFDPRVLDDDARAARVAVHPHDDHRRLHLRAGDGDTCREVWLDAGDPPPDPAACR